MAPETSRAIVVPEISKEKLQDDTEKARVGHTASGQAEIKSTTAESQKL